ncbi:MAG: DUF6240 domain-containing protein [Lachnospiraceae bacterium]|nr:DUF6240 domain-containing protein [Lachnospiraceae bacterium]
MNNISVSMAAQQTNTQTETFQSEMVSWTRGKSSILNHVGTVVKGTVSGVGEQAKVRIGDRDIPVRQELLQNRKVGDEISFMVEATDGKSVALKIMQEYVGAEAGESSKDVLKNVSQLKVQRNTEEFAGILSESDLRVDVTEDVGEDAKRLSGLSAEDLRMLRRLGIDVANSDLSHLMGLVNQYHAQQEGRTFQTGSPEVTEAIAKAQNMGKISDAALKYMMDHQMSFTYENAYKAEFSAVGQQPQQELSATEWQQLRPQVDKMLESQEIIVNQETEQVAKWLIEQGCDISRDNLLLFQQVSDYNDNGLDVDNYRENVVSQLNVGGSAQQALLCGTGAAVQAEEIVEQLQNVGYEACEQVEKEEETPTLEHLFAAQYRVEAYHLTLQQEVDVRPIEQMPLQQENGEKDTFQGDSDASSSTYYQLQEIRLRLTVQASYQMIQKGFPLMQESLKDIIEELNQIDREQTAGMFRDSRVAYTSSSEAVYQETMVVTAVVPKLPIATLGVVAGAQEALTLHSIYRQGVVVAAGYSHLESKGEGAYYETIGGAVSSYETMMTKPRADMGDSVKKAFDRMDSLLEEMGIDATKENQKAARILAYNQMELSRENIQKIVQLDVQLMGIIQDMQPEIVLGLIRDGINPLKLSLSQLRKEIDFQKEKNGTSSEESYSQFLYQMDSTGAMEKEERDSYIGIYRLLKAVTSYSDRDLGAVVKNEQEVTLANLLSAHRSRKQQGKEIVIDDAFGLLQDMENSGTSITEQISAAFSKLKQDMAQSFSSYDGTHQEELCNLEQKSMEQLSEVSKEGLNLLQRLELPYTPANLTAAQNLLRHSGAFYQEIRKELVRRENRELTAFDTLEEKIFARIEELDSLEDAGQEEKTTEQGVPLYQDAFESAFHIMDEQMRFTGRDVMAVRQIRTMMRLADAMEQNQNYMVPITVGDEVLTMTVRFQSQQEGQQGFFAEVDTLRYGVVQAQLQLQEDRGMLSFYCESGEGAEAITRQQDVFVATLNEMGIQMEMTQTKALSPETLMERFLSEEPLNDSRATVEKEEGTKVKSRTLYESAKALVGLIRAL